MSKVNQVVMKGSNKPESKNKGLVSLKGELITYQSPKANDLGLCLKGKLV